MSSTWNNLGLHLSIFGESHGNGIGVVLDGIPGGTPINLDELNHFMQRRAPGHSSTSTRRKESDQPEILSGVLQQDGTPFAVACGTPIAAVIRNTDTHSADYEQMSTLARPGHGDYTGHLRYHGCNDPRGGGHFSARHTAPLVFAGGICKQLLALKGIRIGAHVLQIGSIQDTFFDPLSIPEVLFDTIAGKAFPVIDNGNRVAGTQLDQLSEEAKQALETADVILAKGMANVETMLGCGYNIFYAFLIKCQRFVDRFGAPMFTPMLVKERT